MKDSDLKVKPLLKPFEDNYDRYDGTYVFVIVRKDAYVSDEMLHTLDELVKNSVAEKLKGFSKLKNDLENQI